MPDHRPPPRLRWTSEPVTRDPIFVVPGDAAGSGTLKPMGKTWGMRVSGDVDKLVPHEYVCPVHGRFIVEVKASEVPDDSACTAIETDWIDPAKWVSEGAMVRWNACGQPSPWAGSFCAIGIEPGMVTG